jgi:hypothetical protein
MFAIPLFASGERAGRLLRLAAFSGLAMTLLYVVTALFPIVDVPSPLTFGLKVGGVVAGLNLAGALFYVRAKARREIRLKATALS